MLILLKNIAIIQIIDSMDTLAITPQKIGLKRTSSSPLVTYTPSRFTERETPQKKFDLTRNQGVETLLKSKSTFLYKELIKKHAAHVGLVKDYNSKLRDKGLGSGLMVSSDLFLTSKHLLPKTPDGKQELQVLVRFQNVVGSSGNKYVSYTGKLADIENEEVKSLGIDFGPNSDLALLQLDKTRDDFPTTYAQLKKFDAQEYPRKLLYLGYKNGTRLKVSVSETRSVHLLDAINRQVPILNERLSWSNRQTVGVIRSIIHAEGSVWLLVESKGQKRHVFEVRDAHIFKHYKKGETKEVFLTLERPMWFGEDHVVVGHNTGPGCSGGVYFTPEGELFAIHRGRVDSGLLVDDAQNWFENHLAIYPWKTQITNFYKDYLREESSSIDKSDINYSKFLNQAAEELSISSKTMTSRKPHTKKGQGSSGTDHERANAQAATHAKDIVQDKIEKKTGIRMEPERFLNEAEKEKKANRVRDEKNIIKVNKLFDKQGKYEESYKKWLRCLMPESVVNVQTGQGNELVTRCAEKEERKLSKMADENDWPKEWSSDYLQMCYR